MHQNKIKKHSLRDRNKHGNMQSTHDPKFDSLVNITVYATDYVATAIELIDLTKLSGIAKIEYVIPLLEELHRISVVFPKIGKNHSSTNEIEEWIKKLQSRLETSWVKLFSRKQKEILQAVECKTLEFAVTRWLSNFRFLLRTG